MANFNLEKTLRRIEEKVSKIAISLHIQTKEEKPKETWVKVGVIQQLTGWDKNQLRSARRNGLVIKKTSDEGIYYLLESLNPMFFRQSNVSNGEVDKITNRE